MLASRCSTDGVIDGVVGALARASALPGAVRPGRGG